MGYNLETSPLLPTEDDPPLSSAIETSSEIEININNSAQPKLYKKRWLALALFCMVTMSQCAVWITYSSVADTAIEVYRILR